MFVFVLVHSCAAAASSRTADFTAVFLPPLCMPCKDPGSERRKIGQCDGMGFLRYKYPVGGMGHMGTCSTWGGGFVHVMFEHVICDSFGEGITVPPCRATASARRTAKQQAAIYDTLAGFMAKRGECVTQRLCCAFVLVALSMSTVTSTSWSAPPDGISRLPCFLASTSTHQRAAASAPRPTLTTTSTDNLHRHHRRILLVLSPPASHRKSEQALLPWSSRFPSAVSRQKCGAIGVSSPDTISTSLSRRKSTRRCWRSRSNGNTPRSIAATALNGVAGGAAAAAAGSETRTGEGAAAAAAATAGAVEGRPGGHNSTTSSCRDGGGGRSSDGNPGVPPAACTGGERWGREEQRVGRR